MKKSVFALVAVCAAFVFSSCSNAILDDGFETEIAASRAVVKSNLKTYTMANEIYDITCLGYNEGEKGPIVIHKGTLSKWWSSKTVYLVTLSGTELVDNQATGLFTDLLVGFNMNNYYLRNVVSVIRNNIPAGSNLIIAGHSLGGMVAQQVAADDDVKKSYNVLNTVTFGSPLISAGDREGTTKRLGDVSDLVPYLSATGSISKEMWKIVGLQRENGGYGLNYGEAHTESYKRSDVWGKYDVTGTKNGGAKLTLDLDSIAYYRAPIWD